MKDLRSLRREFNVGSLLDEDIPDNPMELFQAWFEHVVESGDIEPNAMALSTVDSQGVPSSRIVLLKDVEGFTFSFYTNYDSEKGQHLAANNHACLLFYWPQATRQIRITGTVAKVPREQSEEYFASRPRGSQLGAVASAQSSPVESGAALKAHLEQLEKEFEGTSIPCPENWGGYVLTAEKIEFWQGRPNRLHDRFVFTRSSENNSWQHERLQP